LSASPDQKRKWLARTGALLAETGWPEPPRRPDTRPLLAAAGGVTALVLLVGGLPAFLYRGATTDPAGYWTPFPTLDEVNAEPERFDRKTVVLKALLVPAVMSTGDAFELQVLNENHRKAGNVTFRVSPGLAQQLGAAKLRPAEYPVELTCKVTRTGGRWYAEVSQVSVINDRHQLVKTFK
jgi:hypothetical protein